MRTDDTTALTKKGITLFPQHIGYDNKTYHQNIQSIYLWRIYRADRTNKQSKRADATRKKAYL